MFTIYVCLNIFVVLFIFIMMLFQSLEAETIYGMAAWMGGSLAVGYGMLEVSLVTAQYFFG